MNRQSFAILLCATLMTFASFGHARHAGKYVHNYAAMTNGRNAKLAVSVGLMKRSFQGMGSDSGMQCCCRNKKEDAGAIADTDGTDGHEDGDGTETYPDPGLDDTSHNTDSYAMPVETPTDNDEHESEYPPPEEEDITYPVPDQNNQTSSDVGNDYVPPSDAGVGDPGSKDGISPATRPNILSAPKESLKLLTTKPLPLTEIFGKRHDITYRATPQGQLSCQHNIGKWMTSNGDPLVIGIPDVPPSYKGSEFAKFFWNNAQSCGQCYFMERKDDPSKHVLVVGVDYCPGCMESNKGFDMNKAALEQLGFTDGNGNTDAINMYPASCGWGEEAKFALGQGSHEGLIYLLVIGNNLPISAVTLIDDEDGVEFKGTVDGVRWKFDFHNDYDGKYTKQKRGKAGSKFKVRLESEFAEPVVGDLVVGVAKAYQHFPPVPHQTDLGHTENNDYPDAEKYLQTMELISSGIQF